MYSLKYFEIEWWRAYKMGGDFTKEPLCVYTKTFRNQMLKVKTCLFLKPCFYSNLKDTEVFFEHIHPYALSLCTWFLKNQVWNLKFDEKAVKIQFEIN